MDKVLCPYCGAEMIQGGVNTVVHVAWWHCAKCRSVSPRCQADDQKTAVELARAAAMQRYVEPNRVLTLNEIRTIAKDPNVGVFYVEYNDRYYTPDDMMYTWIQVVDMMLWVHRELRETREGKLLLPRFKRGVGWRAWLRRPTDEERGAVAWG